MALTPRFAVAVTLGCMLSLAGAAAFAAEFDQPTNARLRLLEREIFDSPDMTPVQFDLDATLHQQPLSCDLFCVCCEDCYDVYMYGRMRCNSLYVYQSPPWTECIHGVLDDYYLCKNGCEQAFNGTCSG